MAAWTITVIPGGGNSLNYSISPSNSGSGTLFVNYQVASGDTITWDNDTGATISVVSSGFLNSNSFSVLNGSTQVSTIIGTGTGIQVGVTNGVPPNTNSVNIYFTSSAPPITYGGPPPTERDHGNNSYIAMNGGTVAYATSQSSTTITERKPLTNSTSSVLTTVANPTRGTFAAATGSKYSANKPIHFNSSGFGHRMVPLTAKGKEFGDYHNRGGDQTYFFYAEQDTNVAIYDNVTGGIEGTSTSSFVLSASTVQTYTRPASNSSTYIFFASDADMVMSKTAGSGAGVQDKHIMAPAATYMYYRRGQYVRAVDNSTVTNSTGGASNAGVTYDTAGDRVIAVGIGDGAGGDSEQGVGGHNLSNTYLWPWSLRDFVLVAPNTNTIHVESFGSGSWTTEATYTFTGTTTSPQNVRRDGDSGFTTTGTNYAGNAATFNTRSLWRFRGSDVFFVAVNDNSTDEEAIYGFTGTVVTTPTDLSVSNPTTQATTVTATVTASNGTGGVIQVSDDNSTWVSNGSSFSFSRNTPQTFYARRFLSSENLFSASVYSEALTVPYLTPDTSVSISPLAQSRSAAGTASWTISGTTVNHFYQLEDAGGNFVASGSAAGTSLVLTASAASATAWPNEGDTLVVEGLVKLATNRGGDGNFDNIPTTSLSARLVIGNTNPFPFFFSDVTSASVGQVYYTYVQITGTGGVGQTASILSGTASTAVSSSITQPSDASFTAANKTINENQYLHVKKQASSSSAVEVSTTIQVGEVSDTWNITTSVGQGDYGVIVYDDGANKVWNSGEPTKTVRNLDAFTVTLFPPNVGSNSAIVALEGVQSQADLEASYVLQSAGGTSFGLFSGAGDPVVEFESTGFIKCTWSGYCVDIFGQSRPCVSSDATTTTFFPLVIGKDIE